MRAFSYCEKLSEQIIPENIKTIGDRAFVGCSALEYAIIENNDVAIGKDVFEECEKTIVIATSDSKAYEYCVDNNLRWSTSKSVDAIILGGDEEAASSEDTIVVSVESVE